MVLPVERTPSVHDRRQQRRTVTYRPAEVLERKEHVHNGSSFSDELSVETFDFSLGDNDRISRILPLEHDDRALDEAESPTRRARCSSKFKSPVHIEAEIDYQKGKLPVYSVDKNEQYAATTTRCGSGDSGKSSFHLFYKFFEASVDSWLYDWETPYVSDGSSTDSHTLQSLAQKPSF